MKNLSLQLDEFEEEKRRLTYYIETFRFETTTLKSFVDEIKTKFSLAKEKANTLTNSLNESEALLSRIHLEWDAQ